MEVGEPMDSSFCFETSENEEYLSSSQCKFTELGNCTGSLGDDTSCTDPISLVSGEEIWENSSDDDVGPLSR